jgi:hypothetical protein
MVQGSTLTNAPWTFCGAFKKHRIVSELANQRVENLLTHEIGASKIHRIVSDFANKRVENPFWRIRIDIGASKMHRIVNDLANLNVSRTVVGREN